MDIISFETASRLKEAGFPQPESFQFGQIFYKESITGSIVPLIANRLAEGKPVTNEYTFAPSFEDILYELSKAVKGKAIVRVDISSHNGGEGDDTPQFSVSIFPWQDDITVSPNPVELAAITLLSVCEKKS